MEAESRTSDADARRAAASVRGDRGDPDVSSHPGVRGVGETLVGLEEV